MTQGRIFSKGLHTCGSVWICAWCTAKNRYERYEQIQEIINAFQKKVGGQLLLQTLTISHAPTTSLLNLMKGFRAAWKLYNSGEAAKSEKTNYSQFGYIRALEIRHSPTAGWNVHVHILRMIDGFLDSRSMNAWHTNCVNRWASSLQAVGMRKPSNKGQDIRELSQSPGLSSRMAEYLTNQVAVPFFKRQIKTGASRSAWEVLEDYASAPNDNDKNLWREYESGTKSSRQLQTSSNLREKLGITNPYLAKNTKEEFIDIQFSDSGISKLVRNPELRAEAHQIYKKHGLDAICVWLEEQGFDYELKTGLTNKEAEDELLIDWVDT